MGDDSPTKKANVVKDKAIVHEVKLNRRLMFDSPKKQQQEPKRDPILQNNGEKNIEPPRRHISLEKNAKKASRDEVFVRAKKAGDYNYNINPPNQDPKPQGIKPFVILPSECRDERARKIANNRGARAKSTDTGRNPITEGDDYFRKPALKAVIQTADSNSNFLNERRFLMKSERGYTSNNPHLATTLTLGDETEYESMTERSRSRSTQRPVSAIEHKMRGYAKGVLEYESGPNYRSEKITEKCGTVKFSDLKRGLENERVFGRKRSIC